MVDLNCRVIVDRFRQSRERHHCFRGGAVCAPAGCPAAAVRDGIRSLIGTGHWSSERCPPKWWAADTTERKGFTALTVPPGNLGLCCAHGVARCGAQEDMTEPFRVLPIFRCHFLTTKYWL